MDTYETSATVEEQGRVQVVGVPYAAGRDDWRWIVSPEILAEYADVLRRPKFALDEPVLKGWTALLALRTINVGSPPEMPDFPRDPKDAPFLAAALAARADLLITG